MLSCLAAAAVAALVDAMRPRPHDQEVLAEAVAQSSRQEFLPLH
jgi:hypothetical protein